MCFHASAEAWSFYEAFFRRCVTVNAYSTHDRLLCVGVTKLHGCYVTHEVWIIHELRAFGETGLFWVVERRSNWILFCMKEQVLLNTNNNYVSNHYTFLERKQQHSHLSLFRCSPSLNMILLFVSVSFLHGFYSSSCLTFDFYSFSLNSLLDPGSRSHHHLKLCRRLSQKCLVCPRLAQLSHSHGNHHLNCVHFHDDNGLSGFSSRYRRNHCFCGDHQNPLVFCGIGFGPVMGSGRGHLSGLAEPRSRPFEGWCNCEGRQCPGGNLRSKERHQLALGGFLSPCSLSSQSGKNKDKYIYWNAKETYHLLNL